MASNETAGPAGAAMGAALRRYRAERLLRRDFDGLRERVLAVVGSRLSAHGAAVLDRRDLEACYATAWHGLYTAMANGERIEDTAAWLALVTFRRALDEGRSIARKAPGLERRRDERQPVAAPHEDVVDVLGDRAKLRHLFEALRARLSAREREAVSLCYLQGLSRAEAAARIGVSPARMRKLMDGANGRPGVASKFGELVQAVGAEAWCEQQGSLLRAYAFGLLDPDGERHRLAVAHVRECPACRRWVACLRGIAAVLPPVALPLPLGPRVRLRARLHTGAGTRGTMATKLAGAVAVTAALGGGYAMLVKGAPTHPARVARPAGATAATTFPTPLAHRAHTPNPHRAHSRQAQRRQTPSQPVGRHAMTRPTSQPSRPTSQPGRPTTQPSGPSAPAGPPSSGGEFTPERARL